MQRLASLDAFRGFAIASMMLVNNPGDWGHLHAPLAHAKWNGWTFTDLVFPFFLFAAGMSMAISVDRRTRDATAPPQLMKELARRAAVIFLVGLALNLFPAFDFSNVRIPGVLQRIALCVLIAAPLAVHGSSKAIGLWIAVLLAAYTLPMLLVPVPGPDGIVAAGALEPGRDFGAWVDRQVFGGHLWSQSRTWDPEGLVSTLPAVCSLLFGVLAGRWLLVARAGLSTTVAMLAAGIAALVAGLVLDAVLMPINKNLWTPSYCVFMTGWSLVVFAAFHAAMDAAPSTPLRTNARRILLPLTIYGMNALFLFALSGVVARLLGVIRMGGEAGAPLTLKAWLYAPLQALPIAPENASLLFAIAFDLVMFAVAWAMWKKRWFVKA
jgi:predicted acyltransferase